MNGKGSRSRVSDHKRYRKNYERIFKKPNPGSAEAIEQNCTCPVIDNNHGRGSDYGPNMFWYNADCPLHGISPKRSAKPPAKSNLQRGFYRFRKD